MSEKRSAYWTYDELSVAYYFAPTDHSPPPYYEQREVTAILDIASDGTLAGVELVWGDLPPPPPRNRVNCAGAAIEVGDEHEGDA